MNFFVFEQAACLDGCERTANVAFFLVAPLPSSLASVGATVDEHVLDLYETWSEEVSTPGYRCCLIEYLPPPP